VVNRNPVRLIVPGDPLVRFGDAAVLAKFKENNIDVISLQINPSDLSPEAWCELFDISINEVMGITLWRAVNSLQEKNHPFTIEDILREIQIVKKC
jgi:hypothetical protein